MRLTIRRLTLALALLCAGLLPQTASAQTWRLGYVNSDALSASSFPWSYYTHVAVLGLNCNGSGSLFNPFSYNTANWTAYRSAATTNGVKFLLLLGGNMASCTTSGNLSSYVSQIVSVMNGTNGSLTPSGLVFDGVTLDWEAGFSTGNEGQYENLISSLRSSMGSKIIALAGWRQQMFLDVLLNQSSHIDMFLNEMYDTATSSPGNSSGQEWSWYNMSNSSISGLNSGSAEGSANWYVSGGWPMSKISEGIPFYGYLYSACTHSEILGCQPTGTQYDYRTIRNNSSWWSAPHGNDATNGADYITLSGGAGYVTYSDVTQIGQLTSWGKSVGLGGYFTWEVDFETLSGGSQAANFPLSAAIFSGSSGGAAPTAPTINSFTATPSSISSGSSSTLAWSISGTTTSVSISGIGPVTGTSASVSPLTSTTYTLTAQNGTASSSKNVTVTVTPSGTCNITTTSLPGAVQSAPYSQALNQAGCSGSWSVSSGSLPAGLSLSGAGVISGTPTGTGSSSFTVAVGTDTQALSLNVAAAAACSITSTSLPAATVGTSYSQTPSSSGCSGTWAISSGALPPGLSLNSSTGAITGTPTTAGTFSFTLANGTTSKPLSILVNASCSIVTSALPGGVVGSAYSQTLSESGCSGSWSATGLPPGFSISGSTLSGTPSVAGSTSVTLSIGTASKTLVLAISPASGGYDGNIDISQMQTRVLSGGLNGIQLVTTAGVKTTGDPLVWDSHGNAITGEFPGGGGGSGSLTFLEEHTASSSAELDFTSWYSVFYDVYEIHVINLIPATGSVDLQLQMSTDGGGTYDTGANYETAAFRMSSSASASAGGTGLSAIGLAGLGNEGTDSTGGVTATYRLFSPASTSLNKRVVFNGSYTISGILLAVMGTGSYDSTTAINALRFTFSSGNIASGTIRVYGIAH